MGIIVFEDDAAAQLAPIALGRPAFAITCGSWRLIDLLQEIERPLTALVRPYLREIVALDYPFLKSKPQTSGPWLVVNARLAPTMGTLHELRRLLAAGKACQIRSGETLLAAIVVQPLTATTGSELLAQVAGQKLPTLDEPLPHFDYPHDVIRHHLTSVGEIIQHRLQRDGYREVADGVFALSGATIGPYSVVDSKNGPILLDEEASLGPYCLLRGPLYIGAKARVIEHAALKDGSTIGHHTKIGGEVESSIIESHTNKQHHGFLGHSYVGRWVNLGAGTCNSDLKNTYGLVNAEYRGQKVATGMQFVGTTIGDYAKTAINTSIFTGKTIGACSMVYGFVTTNVPSFVNYARTFGQVTEAPVDVLIATQKRMFARRGVEQRPCDIQLLRDMYALTEEERKLPGTTISIEPLSL